MIELNVFQRDSDSDIHTVRFSVNGYVSHHCEVCSSAEIIGLKDRLEKEVKFLDAYLKQKGLL